MKTRQPNKPKNITEHLNGTVENCYQRIPLPYHSLDIKGVLIDVNYAWLETFGYTRKDVVNRPFTNLLTEEYHEIFEDNFSIFIEKGGSFRRA